MEKFVIGKEQVKPLFESKFIKVYDLQYEEGRHYYDASRRNADELMACKSEEEFKKALPDAVSCFVILQAAGEEPRLLLSYEYRYPAGQFLLSPPAGLIDPEDRETDQPLIRTAIREIKEETGLDVKDNDRVFVISPLSFSTPGMTDESNGLVCAVLQVENLDGLSQTGAVGTEKFDGFELLTREDARRILRQGTDDHGIYYSIFTWAALTYFAADLWKDE